MVESTRVAYVGTVQVHLKKQLEITEAVVAEVPQLPNGKPWHVLRYNPNSGSWLNAESFDSFEAADEAFVARTQSQGYDGAGRLTVSPSNPNERGRLVGPPDQLPDDSQGGQSP